MQTQGYAVRVGLLVLAAAALVGGMFTFFNQVLASKTYRLHVLFADVTGIDKGSKVQMVGVDIGQVTDIQLQGDGAHVDLALDIKQKYHIPAGSQFVINTASLLSAQGTVNVIPQASAQKSADVIPPGAPNLRGTRALDLQSTMTSANKLLDQLTVTTAKAQVIMEKSSSLLTDPKMQRHLQQSVANVDAATSNGVALTHKLDALITQDNAMLQGMLGETQRTSRVALGNITETTAQIKYTTTENREKINEIIGNLRDTTAAVEGITAQANQLLSEGGVSKNLSQIVANLNVTTQKLAQMTSDFQKVSADQSLQGDLKQTVHNVRETSEQTTILVQRLNKLLGVKDKKPTVVVAPGAGTVIIAPGTTQVPKIDNIPLILPRVDFQVNTRTKRFRSDIDAFVPLGGGNSFAQVGVYDFTESNKLNLQMGQSVGKNGALDLRAGLHASKFGVGADYGLGRGVSLSADYYDPNHARLDARGTLMLNQNLGLLFGLDDVTHHAGAVVGVELRR
ncbi:MAG: MlaD family protein [Capsulimonas sp.]|uniref:MlaD family protein n=1 Tax=Capsulimonas sp. TaxID=2494211 RepID=UPI003263D56B